MAVRALPPIHCAGCMWCRSAAWWLGENANFGTGEYAWAPKQLAPELVQQLETADGATQQQLAAAAVAANPVLCLLIARLQRVVVAGLWEVRIAAAQVSTAQMQHCNLQTAHHAVRP